MQVASVPDAPQRPWPTGTGKTDTALAADIKQSHMHRPNTILLEGIDSLTSDFIIIMEASVADEMNDTDPVRIGTRTTAFICNGL